MDLTARDLKHSLRQIRGSAPARLPASLNSLRLRGTASGTLDSLRLRDARCGLGWQQVDGEAAVTWSGTPQLDLRLHAADFDLDRLLAELFSRPGPQQGAEQGPGRSLGPALHEGRGGPGGSLDVDRVRFMRLRMQKMRTRFSLKDGHLAVPALEGDFYNSRLRASGDFHFDRGLSYTTRVRALNIDLGAASNDRNDKRAVRGLASVESEMSAHLTGGGQMPAALSGTWGVAIINGSYQDRDKAGRPGGRPTRFQRLSASGNMQNGVARSSNIFYQDAEMRVAAAAASTSTARTWTATSSSRPTACRSSPVRVTGTLHASQDLGQRGHGHPLRRHQPDPRHLRTAGRGHGRHLEPFPLIPHPGAFRHGPGRSGPCRKKGLALSPPPLTERPAKGRQAVSVLFCTNPTTVRHNKEKRHEYPHLWSQRQRQGHQGNLVKAKYNLAHIESGAIFREHIGGGTELGKRPRNTLIAATWCPTTSPSPWCWRP